MVMIGIIVGVIFAVVVILCVKLKHGYLFEPMFSDDFPEELKPYIREYPLKYFVARHARITPFLERYEKAKRGNVFSLEGFLLDEKEKLMQMKKNRR